MEVPRDRLELRDDPGLLSPPTITVPLYGCAAAVNLVGYVPDARLDLEVAGAVVVAGFFGASPAPYGATLPLAVPLAVGQQVRARQATAAGVTSAWSAPATVVDHRVDYPAGPPRPELFPVPLYECGDRTGVDNLLVGCDVRITQDAAPAGAVRGANNPQGVDVNPAYVTSQQVRAWAELCGDASPPSRVETVQPRPTPPLPAPGFEPYHDGVTTVTVTGVVDGARVTVSRNAVVIGTFRCWGGRLLVGGLAPVAPTDQFSATQQLCAFDPPSPPGTADPTPCAKLSAPKAAPVRDGDTQVVLTSFVPGGLVKVFVNFVKVGEGSGPVVTLTAPVPPEATVHVWQLVGTCQGATVEEVKARCFTPRLSADPSGLDLFPVGTHEYDGGQVAIDGFTYDVRGSVYYPAEDDGLDQPFHQRLAGLGPVPLVVCVHGAHGSATPSYLGYDYFQQQLARAGFVAVSVDERQTDLSGDHKDWTQNIVRRAELALESIRFLTGGAGAPFDGHVDFGRTGLMGHSRGGDCVIAAAERNTLAGVNIRAVLSLAPVNSGANSGRPNGYAFMTILPAADGDVVENSGAQFYDQASADPVKTQLYVDNANHNYFNRQWLEDDTGGGLPVMARSDHERVLSTYGCAFFRFALRGDATFDYLVGKVVPPWVPNEKVHLSYAVAGARTVDSYENHPITIDDEGQPTAQLGVVAVNVPFHQVAGSFNASFFGNTRGNVATADRVGRFREPLNGPADLGRADVLVRAAEVFQDPNLPATPTGFQVGLESAGGAVAWIDIDDVGPLPRPFDRRNFDNTTKTMLSTFRFPGRCFAASADDPEFDVSRVVAVLLGLNRQDGRPIAFDDLQIVPS